MKVSKILLRPLRKMSYLILHKAQRMYNSLNAKITTSSAKFQTIEEGFYDNYGYLKPIKPKYTSKHPNYPTLELAALGGTVVTTKWRSKQNLDHYSKNIFMADPSVDDMAEKIVEAVLLPDEVREQNYLATNINTDWNKALEAPLKEVLDKLGIDVKSER